MSPPLADRSTNLQMQTQTARGQQNLHKSLLDRQLADRDGKSSKPYVSPSDAILSPASQKLASLKQRQIVKQ
ncbi:hypothetical protein BDY17DRAFT_323625 [Neohortaea acidophila]|uniref:Uncharacterized protein n=1 Tax=Neohortaea acidophila TaxID=245834 RepID=A0A6A6PX98_9PEZI|nr:uncharacterized protein BDY17DRAFT_323625 [Neohortaea acidophila]KAF2484798.1 hypothetical protein BDY17DRAFT_323625 [Neohortaea acidophila]